jgi:hypothetical protein
MFFPHIGDTAMPMAPSIFVVGLFGRVQNYDIDRLQIMSKVEVKRSLLKFCHATLAQWDSNFAQLSLEYCLSPLLLLSESVILSSTLYYYVFFSFFKFYSSLVLSF